MRIAAFGLTMMLASMAAGAKAAPGPQLVEADIPTRGCPTAGMAEDQPPPVLPPTIRMHVPATEAGSLTYYRAAWSKGVLGPRNWACAARSGSDGIALTVGPSGSDLKNDRPAAGQLIVLRLIEGGTSGRFAAAAVLARAFPAFSAFAKGVAAQHQDSGRIVFHPFPSDELATVSDRVVIFRTPGGHDGLGTSGGLGRGPLPIGGFVSVAGTTEAPQVTMLTVRLPRADEDLSSFIVAQGMEETVGAASRKP